VVTSELKFTPSERKRSFEEIHNLGNTSIIAVVRQLEGPSEGTNAVNEESTKAQKRCSANAVQIMPTVFFFSFF
jgi:hypothetical protein